MATDLHTQDITETPFDDEEGEILEEGEYENSFEAGNLDFVTDFYLDKPPDNAYTAGTDQDRLTPTITPDIRPEVPTALLLSSAAEPLQSAEGSQGNAPSTAALLGDYNDIQIVNHVENRVVPSLDVSSLSVDTPINALATTGNSSISAELPRAHSVIAETSTNASLARDKIRSSTLLTDEDLRQELFIFLEAPEYYYIRGRSMTKKEMWEFKLEQSAEGENGDSWWIVVKPAEHDWQLERRLAEASLGVPYTNDANSAVGNIDTNAVSTISHSGSQR